MKLITILSSLLVFNSLFAQHQLIVLDGKIDKYPIIMEVEIYDTSCTMRYFYTSQLKDIDLEGSFIDGRISAMAVNEDKNGDNEQIEFTKLNDQYSGVWTNGEKKLLIRLKEIAIDKYRNPYDNLLAVKKLKVSESYNYIKSSKFVFSPDSASTYGPAQLAWYKQKNVDIVFPRIKSGYPATILQKINTALLEKQIEETLNFFDCSAARDGEYYLDVDEIFATENLFSLNINVGYYCGGAHPDFGSEGLNFDTKTGELLTLDDVVWFGKKKPPIANSDAWYEYRDSIFAPKIVEIFKKLYPAKMKTRKEDDGEECDYSDPEIWDFVNWNFTDKGLHLGAYFARVARACDDPEWAIIPYKILRNYLNPQLKLKLPD